jgi:hypothetical protein
MCPCPIFVAGVSASPLLDRYLPVYPVHKLLSRGVPNLNCERARQWRGYPWFESDSQGVFHNVLVAGSQSPATGELPSVAEMPS